MKGERGIMSPRRRRAGFDPASEMSEEMLYTINAGSDISRVRAKCPFCDFECSRMTELNVHMKSCHPGK